MKAKKRILTAATLSAFLAMGAVGSANTSGGVNGKAANTNTSGKRRHRIRHIRPMHKGGKRHKKGLGANTGNKPPK